MNKYPIQRAQSMKLSNGFKYIYYPWHDNEVICLQVCIRVGSAHETLPYRGFSHLVEHLCFKSTRSFPNNDLSDYVSRIGGSMNAYTDFDTTCYYLNLPANKMEEGVRILAEIVRWARFSESDLELEKAIIIEEIKQYEADPESAFTDYIQSSYFIDSPLALPIIGSSEQVMNAKLIDVKEFYLKNYDPPNVFLVACGAFSVERFNQCIEAEFLDWNTLRTPAEIVHANIEPEVYGFRSNVFDKNDDAEFIAITLPELSELHVDSEHYLIGMRYLAIGKSSLLHKRLVERDGLCASVRVLSLSGLMSGISILLLTCLSKANPRMILEAFSEEFNRCIRFEPSSKDYMLILKDVIHSWLYDFDTMENLASSLAAEELLGDYNRLYEYDSQIAEISADSVKQKLSKYWGPGSISIYYYGCNPNTAQYIKNLDTSLFDTTALIVHPQEELDVHFVPTTTGTASCSIYQVSEGLFWGKLDNGFSMVLKQSNRAVSGFCLTTDLCQLMEDDTNRGHNLFTTTGVIYGSKNLSHDRLMDISRFLGLNIRVSHHMDCSSYRGKCFNPDLKESLPLLSDLLLNPVYPSKYLSILKSSTIDSLRRERDIPVSYAYHRWFNLMFGRKNNIERSSGSIVDVRRVKRADLFQWHQYLIDPTRMVLAVVGDYDPREFSELVSDSFSDFSSPYSANNLKTLPYYQSAKCNRIVEQRQLDQSIIYIGGFAPPSQNNLDSMAFHILAQAIGGDVSSRFYSILREKYGYTYQAGFDYNTTKDFGYWIAYAYCDPNDFLRVENLMIEILSDVWKNGLIESEVNLSKSYLAGNQCFDYESSSWLASALSNLSALGYPPMHLFDRVKRIQQVDANLIRYLASNYLNPQLYYSFILT